MKERIRIDDDERKKGEEMMKNKKEKGMIMNERKERDYKERKKR
jgi:hypothetical protein